MECAIAKSRQYKEYLAASNEVSDFLKRNEVEPKEVARRYKKALESYRKYLDHNGYGMPKPICEYDRNDKSTWKYLDLIIGNGTLIGEVINSNWLGKGAA